MSNGNYRIVIAVTKSGLTLIGASDVNHYDSRDAIADRQYVYGVQIGHRCAVLTPDGYEIMTPTQAAKAGYTETISFPSKPWR